jgi:NAD-specific glutamate dehydrogenase
MEQGKEFLALRARLTSKEMRSASVEVGNSTTTLKDMSNVDAVMVIVRMSNGATIEAYTENIPGTLKDLKENHLDKYVKFTK